MLIVTVVMHSTHNRLSANFQITFSHEIIYNIELLRGGGSRRLQPTQDMRKRTLNKVNESKCPDNNIKRKSFPITEKKRSFIGGGDGGEMREYVSVCVCVCYIGHWSV